MMLRQARFCLVVSFGVWCGNSLLWGQQAPTEATESITNSIGVKMVLIPAGEFMMGSREAACEQPLHRVRITKPFYLGACEVTRGQFRQFVEDTNFQTDAENTEAKGIVVIESVNGKTTFRLDPEGSWRKVGFEQTDEHPVVGVSWRDATAFCQWLSRKERETYRLPTEAEWEYACQAGTKTRYWSGDNPENLALVANVADAKGKSHFPDWEAAIRGSDGYAYTAPVGKFKANPFGLYDMHGNVWEWCADWYGENFYGVSPADDPIGPDSGLFRVLRGGSWSNRPYKCRSAFRSSAPPSILAHDGGFRLARSK